MVFRVSSTIEAERDLDGILQWLLSEGAGEAGSRWLSGLQDAIASLETTPRRCGLAQESEAFTFEVRQLLYGTRPHMYRILFTIQDEVVTVLHIRHGRRLPLTRH